MNASELLELAKKAKGYGKWIFTQKKASALSPKIASLSPDKIIPLLERYLELEEKYYRLLYVVEDKYPGESRHQTALQTTLDLFRAEVKSNVEAMKVAKAKILTQLEEIASLKEDSIRVCNRETELLKEVERLTDEKERLEYDFNEVFGRKKYFEEQVKQLTKERDVLKSQGTLDESVIRDAGVRLKHLRKALDGMIRHATR